MSSRAGIGPQKFVDRSFRTRLSVDPLDDYRAVEAVSPVLGGQRTWDHDSAARHTAVNDLARFTVVDTRTGADVHAHRDDGVVLDDHAFDDLGARADEAVIADDGRVCLQRLEHAADPDASRE